MAKSKKTILVSPTEVNTRGNLEFLVLSLVPESLTLLSVTVVDGVPESLTLLSVTVVDGVPESLTLLSLLLLMEFLNH